MRRCENGIGILVAESGEQEGASEEIAPLGECGSDQIFPQSAENRAAGLFHYGRTFAQPFWARLELLARLTLNPGKHAGKRSRGLRSPSSQLDWLISMTAMIVLFWSRATRDLLKSFGWGIAALHRYMQRRSCHPRRPPHSVSWSHHDDERG
jgi:hypothetical protein